MLQCICKEQGNKNTKKKERKMDMKMIIKLTPEQINKKARELARILANHELALHDYTQWCHKWAYFLKSINDVDIDDYQKICSIAEKLTNEMIDKQPL